MAILASEHRASKFESKSGFWLAALLESFRQGIASIRYQRRLRRDTEAMLALDDHELSDIGISRSEIEYAVRYGRPPDRWNAR